MDHDSLLTQWMNIGAEFIHLYIQWTLVIVNTWIVNDLSLVNIFGETGRLFYNINYMLNSKHLSLVNKIGDKTEFTITRVHCIDLTLLFYQTLK